MPATRRSVLLGLAALAGCAPSIAPPGGQAVEIVATLDQKPGDPAVTADGRVFFTMHPLNRPSYRLMEARGGVGVPYPDPQASQTAFDNPLGIHAGRDGALLWILDMSSYAGAAAWPASRPPRLIAWNVAANREARTIPLPSAVLRDNSWPQDFALDETHQVAFIADSMRRDVTRDDPPALIALDLRTGAARRILDGIASFRPDPLPAATLHSGLLTARGADGGKHTIEFGLDPITIDSRDEWLYWGPGSGFGIYRARTADLLNPAFSRQDLAGRVERYRDKAASDGIAIDDAGNIYVTDIIRGAVGVSTAAGYRILARDPRMIWPDGLAVGPGGWLYVTLSQFGRMPLVNHGQDKGSPPYLVMRVRMLAPGTVGR